VNILGWAHALVRGAMMLVYIMLVVRCKRFSQRKCVKKKAVRLRSSSRRWTKLPGVDAEYVFYTEIAIDFVCADLHLETLVG
jgi:hypothetical protein